MKVKHLTALGIIVFLSSLPLQGCTTIQPGEVGIKSTLGSLKEEPLKPGVHAAIPLLDNVATLTTRTVAQPEQFSAQTKDNQVMLVTATSTYSLNSVKATEAYSKVGKTNVAIQAVSVQPILLSSVKTVISRYEMDTIIENQTKVSNEIAELVSSRLLKSDYITFQAFDVTGFKLDPNVQEAVEKKQIAIQENQRKDTEILTATKEAQRLEILRKSLTPEILMQQAIQKWDGSGIPPTAGSNLNIFTDSKTGK